MGNLFGFDIQEFHLQLDENGSGIGTCSGEDSEDGYGTGSIVVESSGSNRVDSDAAMQVMVCGQMRSNKIVSMHILKHKYGIQQTS